jgi:shikimate dehydrogenase
MPFGLLGKTLGHSYSPMIYELLGLPGYALFPMEEAALPAFLKSGDLGGLNVTIPYKKTLLPYCDTLSAEAERLGNVNTLLFGPDGKIHGHNTDYAGFVYMMDRAGLCVKGRKVLILGSGGAAQTARLACLDAEAREVVIISRSGENHYGNLHRHRDAQLIINATPVGMSPNEDAAPLSLQGFYALEGVADLIYNPLRTRLMLEAETLGLPVVGGLAMLAEQGRQAARLYLNRDIPPEETLRVGYTLQHQMENIALVGMPGSGKTSVGRELARRTGRSFVDMDELITEKTGRNAARWILEEGEPAFRDKESELLQETLRGRGLVVATGGGGVLRKINRQALRQTSRVYWLERPIELLPTEGRPLSVNLEALYTARRPYYTKAAHHVIDARGSIEEVADAIAAEFEATIRAQWAR